MIVLALAVLIVVGWLAWPLVLLARRRRPSRRELGLLVLGQAGEICNLTEALDAAHALLQLQVDAETDPRAREDAEVAMLESIPTLKADPRR